MILTSISPQHGRYNGNIFKVIFRETSDAVRKTKKYQYQQWDGIDLNSSGSLAAR